MNDSGMTTRSPMPLLVGVEDVSRHLEELILTGRLQPGVKLESERKLAERYGVGRPMVREALTRLEERDLIVIHPARGSFVREFRASQETRSAELTARRAGITARELNRARQALEGEAAMLAAKNRTSGQVRHMQDILEAFDVGRSVEDLADLDIAFHEAIVIASGNAALQVMFGSIRPMTRALMLRSLTDRSVTQAGAPIHHTILSAIKSGRSEAARKHMRAHLHVAETHYGADVDEPLAVVLRRRAELVPSAGNALRDASSRLSHLDNAPPDQLDGTSNTGAPRTAR